MAGLVAHPRHDPEVRLYIAKNKNTRGTLCTDHFAWPANLKERAWSNYLNRHVGRSDWSEIYWYTGKNHRMSLIDKQITEESLTKMQNMMSQQPFPVTIYLVMKPGAKQKTPGITAPRAVLGGARPAPATNSDHLRQLLDELSGINAKYRKYTRK